MPSVEHTAADEKSLIATARAAGVQLWTEGRKLCFRAPPDALTDTLRQALRAGREQVVSALQEEAAATSVVSQIAANQKGLWIIQNLAPESPAYNVAFVARIHGALVCEALNEAFQVLLDRYESLRSTYPVIDGEPRRRIAAFQPVDFIEHDMEGSSDAAVRKAVERDYAIPFDLEEGPLFRARVFRQADDRHVALIVAHHIVLDGTSVVLLLQELLAIYDALTQGHPLPSRGDAAEFSEFVHWQKEVLAQSDEAREFWACVLDPPLARLDLPTDRPRPRLPRHSGRTLRRALPSEVVSALRTLAKTEATTEFVVLLALWFEFLYRITGQSDLTIGTPVHGRASARFSGTIGNLVNMIPIRVRHVCTSSFGQLIQEVRAVVLKSLAHQDFPLPQIVEQSARREDSPGTPFQSVFAYQNFSQSTLLERLLAADEDDRIQIGTLTISPYLLNQQEGHFDISIDAWHRGDELVFVWKYDVDLFDEETIGSWADAFTTLVAAAARDPQAPNRALNHLDILPQGDAARLAEWNATEVEYTKEALLHELISARAAEMPDQIAVLSPEAGITPQLSYAELERRSDALAERLQTLGVGRDVPVAVLMERSSELVVALLAVLKAGGAYVPIDPGYPRERQAFMLEDAAPPVVLTQSRHAPQVPAAFRALAVDALWDDLDDGGCWRPEATPDSLAYIIYTSGTTGRPKGAMIEHRSICNRLFWMQDYFGLNHSDVILQKTPYSFDVSVWEFFWPLLTGARLVMARPEGHKDPAYLVEMIERHGITTLHFVPSMLQLFLEQDVSRCTSLRRVMSSGEALSPALCSRFLGLGLAEFYNLYGPTEAAIGVSVWRCRAEDSGQRVPIGRPLANTQLHVLDTDRRKVPIGVAGELYIGGVQVGRGYLNRPELTQERFLPDPFRSEPGARMYRTGDLARWRADGAIEYLGRTDFQVKIRGFRIELGEIEACLREHAEVREALVLAREDHPGEPRLVAYWVGPETLEVEPLRAHLRAQLPEYMVPAAYVRLDAFPLTPNGKIDRKVLPAPEGDAYLSQAYEPPEGEIETTLAQLWAGLLGVERVGRRDNFFNLGGHSLLAVTLIERMRREGLHADIRSLFTNATLAELAGTVVREAREVEVPPNRIPPGCTEIRPEMLPLIELTQGQIERIVARVPGGAANVQDIYPLAPLQEGILFHHLLREEGDPYLLSGVLGFSTRQELDAVLQAVQAVVNRHDILRTAVVWEEMPEPLQVVWRTAPLHVEEIPIEPTGGEPLRQLQERFDPRRWRMDISQAPLLRYYIAEDAGQGRWLCLLLLHHLAGDHMTAELLQEEVRAFLRGDTLHLSEPLPFRTLVAQARGGASRHEHERFFRALLGDVDEPTAPFGLLEVHGEGADLAEARQDVDTGLVVRLREQARRLGVSTATLCHVAWAQVLASAARQENVVFGTVVFGRMQGGSGADRVMGPFMNTLPIRIRVDGRGVAASVRDTQTLLAELMTHEHASLALAQQCSGVALPMPLFSALLNFRHTTPSTAPQPEDLWTLVPGIYPAELTNYPLVLTVDDLGGSGLSLTAQVSGDVDPERVCSLMHTALERLAEALEEAPDRALNDLDILPAEDRARLTEWNATDVEYPREVLLNELISERAREMPDQIAVLSSEAGITSQLTYAELEQRSDALAARLQALGIGRDVPVAVLMERSAEMVVSLLAVIKAGGAYVPIDPGYPRERQSFMLQDAAPPVVLTQSRHAPQVPAAFRALAVDELWEQLAAGGHWRPEATPDSLAYVIYTSGSTGKPKGVEVPHGAVINFLHSMAQEPGLGVDDVVLALTTISFDIAVLELFLPLMVGARVVILSEAEATDGRRIAERLEQHGVTLMQATPATFKLLLSSGWQGKSGLRVLCGGERLPRTLADDLLQRVSELWNMYGPTETTVWSTVQRIRAGEPILVGRPIANTKIYILDAQQRPVPIGAAGELYVGGHGVANGYMNRPDLTRERFIESPFHPGERLYRTGDQARFRPDGRLEHLGRLDDQVKVRGFRIELGEVEAVLRAHSDVKDAVVVAREDRLVAYLIFRDVELEPESLRAELRAHLRAQLPEYMVPAAYVRLDAFPLTPNGKIDRKVLPAPEGDAYLSQAYEPPEGEIETTLAQLWAGLLGVERVGRRDNFFNLGGHSLLVTRLVSALSERFGVRLSARMFFESDDLAELAQHIALHRSAPAVGPRIGAEIEVLEF